MHCPQALDRFAQGLSRRNRETFIGADSLDLNEPGRGFSLRHLCLSFPPKFSPRFWEFFLLTSLSGNRNTPRTFVRFTVTERIVSATAGPTMIDQGKQRLSKFCAQAALEKTQPDFLRLLSKSIACWTRKIA